MSAYSPIKYQLWYYTPSRGAAIFFSAMFALLTSLHALFLLKTRKSFCIPLVVGGLFETVGYIARAICCKDLESKIPYAVQSVLILLAPILFAASIYMYLGRIITAVHGQDYCIVPTKWLTTMFVSGDILCFLIQGGGGGMLVGASSQARVNLGEHIILSGLILQIVIFGVFIIVIANFHLRLGRMPTPKAHDLPWQALLVGLFVVSTLVTLRNLIRVVEYAMGSGGYFLRHEWTTYVFDATTMSLVLLVSLLWYFNAVAPRKSKQDVILLESAVRPEVVE